MDTIETLVLLYIMDIFVPLKSGQVLNNTCDHKVNLLYSFVYLLPAAAVRAYL